MSPLAPLQALAAAAIALALGVILGAGGTWLHMDAKRDAAYELGGNVARTACADARATAWADAATKQSKEWAATQQAVSKQAASDAASIAANLASSTRTASKFSQDIAAHVAKLPLPAGCVADPVRVRLYDAARGHPAQAPSR